jgi:hypothetical protein
MQQLSAQEVWARDCLRATFPEASVQQNDDGSQSGMHDLTITYPDGRTGAIEVTAAVDARDLELWKLVGGRGKRRIEPSLIGGWVVRILPTTRAKVFNEKLPGLLRALERNDLSDVRGDADSADPFRQLAGQLGIVHAAQGSTAHPGSVYVMPPERPLNQMGGFRPSNGDALAKWISEWISDPSRSDNLSKLSCSGMLERHLFVLLPGFNRASFAVNNFLMESDAPAPSIPPALPSKLTHVWAMSTWDSEIGFRWALDTGWMRFTKTSLH